MNFIWFENFCFWLTSGVRASRPWNTLQLFSFPVIMTVCMVENDVHCFSLMIVGIAFITFGILSCNESEKSKTMRLCIEKAAREAIEAGSRAWAPAPGSKKKILNNLKRTGAQRFDMKLLALHDAKHFKMIKSMANKAKDPKFFGRNKYTDVIFLVNDVSNFEYHQISLCRFFFDSFIVWDSVVQDQINNKKTGMAVSSNSKKVPSINYI